MGIQVMSEAGKVVLVRVGEGRSSLHSISCDHPMTSLQQA